jgi:predicted Zn-dependent peptidase
MEEYRMRVESSPRGKLIQNFLATAFEAHPYRIMGTGWPSDIRSLRVSDALAFYNKYYVPSNITIGVVGDVSPAEARRLADKYFSAMPTRPPAPLLHTAEPPQQGPKQTQVISPSQPFLLVGYKRPSEYDKDDAVFDVMQELLAGGRTSRLYTDMVRDKRMALFASGADTFPGGKYPNLFVFFVGPGLGHTVEENEKELYAVLDRFKNEKVSDVELSRVKTKTRAGLIRRLGNNSGLASLLTAYYADYGDWRKVFTSIEEVNKVTADDVQRVARKYFVPESRTVAFTAQPAKSSRGAQ